MTTPPISTTFFFCELEEHWWGAPNTPPVSSRDSSKPPLPRYADVRDIDDSSHSSRYASAASQTPMNGANGECPDGTRSVSGYCLCRKISEPPAPCSEDPDDKCLTINLGDSSSGAPNGGAPEPYTAFLDDCTTCVCPTNASYGSATPAVTNFDFAGWDASGGAFPKFESGRYLEGARWISAGIDHLRTDIFGSSSAAQTRKVAIITVRGQGSQKQRWCNEDGSGCETVFDYSGGKPDQPGDPPKPATVAARALVAQGVELYVIGIGQVEEDGVTCDYDPSDELPQCGDVAGSVLKQELVNIAGGDESRVYYAESFDALAADTDIAAVLLGIMCPASTTTPTVPTTTRCGELDVALAEN